MKSLCALNSFCIGNQSLIFSACKPTELYKTQLFSPATITDKPSSPLRSASVSDSLYLSP